MRIVVYGAAGNVGTSLLDALEQDERVDSALGVAQRLPAARRKRARLLAAVQLTSRNREGPRSPPAAL